MGTSSDGKLKAQVWLRHAKQSLEQDNVFNGYFEAYIALASTAANLAVSQGRYSSSNRDDVDEGVAIEDAMIGRAKDINQFLESPEGTKLRCDLWNRDVAGEDGARIIGEVGSNDMLRNSRTRLGAFWSPIRSGTLSEREVEEQARHLAFLFRVVRNRLFHGTKIYDRHGSDADLLRKVAPIVIGVVEVLAQAPTLRSPQR